MKKQRSTDFGSTECYIFTVHRLPRLQPAIHPPPPIVCDPAPARPMPAIQGASRCAPAAACELPPATRFITPCARKKALQHTSHAVQPHLTLLIASHQLHGCALLSCFVLGCLLCVAHGLHMSSCVCVCACACVCVCLCCVCVCVCVSVCVCVCVVL